MAKDNSLKWKRKVPTQARAKHTVDCILEAAAQIVGREGEDGLTTNKVAERAGCSIGTLYQYYPNREAIQLALFLRECEVIAQQARLLLSEVRPAGLEATVREVLRILIAVFKQRRRCRKMYAAMLVRMAGGGGPPVGLVAQHVMAAWNASELGRTHPLSDSELFVLTQAIRGTLVCALLDGSARMGEPAFEDALVRLVMGFLLFTAPQDRLASRTRQNRM